MVRPFSLETLFKNIISAVLSITGIALFIMLLVGGFSFLFFGRRPKKRTGARNGNERNNRTCDCGGRISHPPSSVCLREIWIF